MSAEKQKVVLVCGASGLFGRSICYHLAQKNHSLILCDIDAAGLDALALDIAPICSAPPVTQVMDIRDETSIAAVFSNLRDTQNIPQAVINTSYPRNKNYGSALEDVQLTDFTENIAWHMGGYFALAKHACLAFQDANGGSLINLSSIYGIIAPRFEIYQNTPMTMPVEYAAIKAGILHMTKYFAQYYKKNGIRVNAVSPGGLKDQQPESFLQAYGNFCGTKGMLDTKDLFGAIDFLIADESRYMTGQNLVIDDGFSL